MTTTLEIPDDVLKLVMRATGVASPQEAILTALKEYAARGDQRSLIPLLGTLHEFMTVDELKKMRETE